MNRHLLSASAFAVVCIVLFVSALIKAADVRFDGSVLSLLPDNAQNALVSHYNDIFIKRLDSQVIYAVGNDTDHKASDELVQKLSQSQYVKKITSSIDDTAAENINRFVFEHRLSLLPEKTRLDLSNQSYPKKVMRSLYSFLGAGGDELSHDPLLLTRQSAVSLSKDSSIKLTDGYLSAKGPDGKDCTIILLELNFSGFDIKEAQDFCEYERLCTDEITAHYTEVQIFRRGSVFFSEYAAKSAAEDITLLGSITLFGVFLLIYLIFKSLTPVFLTLLTIALSLSGGLSLLILCFDTISLILTGMGMCVVGIVCDYTIYYMTYRMALNDLNAIDTIKRMIKPLLFAAITDLCAYLIVLLSPVEPLRQLSVFCMGAISFACLGVILIEPYIKCRVKTVSYKTMDFLNHILLIFKSASVRYSLVTVLLACTLYGVLNFTTNDDPSSFQTLPYDLKRESDFIKTLCNEDGSFTYIMVTAENEDELLDRNDKLKAMLYDAQKEGLIGSFKALPLNSIKTQYDNAKKADIALARLKELFSQNNISIPLHDYELTPLLLDDFLRSDMGMIYNDLITKDEKGYALLALPSFISDEDALKSSIESLEGVYLVDRHKDITAVFKSFRSLLYIVLSAFIVVIFASSLLRLGLKKGLLSSIFCLLSLGFALFVMTISGYSVNIFSILSMILVLGIGVNYGVFFCSNNVDTVYSLLGIVTAMLTTILSLGILIFSSTHAIRGFAIVLTSGIFVSFMLCACLPYFREIKK